jgi:hypothetical protein
MQGTCMLKGWFAPLTDVSTVASTGPLAEHGLAPRDAYMASQFSSGTYL